MRRPRAPNPCPARKPSGSWCEASPGRDCRRVYEICCPGRFAFSDVNHLAPRRHAAPSAKPAIPDAPGFARGLFPELILTLLSPLAAAGWRARLRGGLSLQTNASSASAGLPGAPRGLQAPLLPAYWRGLRRSSGNQPPSRAAGSKYRQGIPGLLSCRSRRESFHRCCLPLGCIG